MPIWLEARLPTLRHLLMGSFYSSGLLFFWLPAHEVFEGPKTMGALLFACALAALAAPLFLARWKECWALTGVKLGAALVAATSASLLGAWLALPANLLLAIEHTAPVWASALCAVVFLLEEADGRRRVLHYAFTSHVLLLFYGVIQVLDQNIGRRLNLVIDLIRWTSFGEGRVYSSLGNPDYMAAQLTLFLPLLLYWHPGRFDVRRSMLAASLALLAIPLFLISGLYLGQPAMAQAFLKAAFWWMLLGAGLLAVAARVKARLQWTLLLGLCVLLIVVAQGRGAYLALLASVSVMGAAASLLEGRAFWRERWQLLRAPVLGLGLAIAAWLGILGLRAVAPGSAMLKPAAMASVLKVTDAFALRLTMLFDRRSDTHTIRLFYWRAALEMGLAHPLFGVGYGNHAMFTAEAQTSVWKRWSAAGDQRAVQVEPHVELYTHNDLLQNFAETGLLGLAAFVAFWAWLIWQAWRLARDPGRRALGLALLGFAAAFVANAMVNFPWRVLATQQWCWLVWAIAVGAAPQPPLPAAAGTSPPGGEKKRTLWGWGMAAIFVGLAVYPIRWFYATSLFKAGNLLKDSNNPAAIGFYEKAVQAGLNGTQRVELYLYLGSMYNVLGRPDKAEEWFKRGTEIYPAFIEAWYNLGYTYQTKNEAEKAQKAFERVLEINPRYANALNNLGNIYFARKEFQKAKEAYEHLLKYNPPVMEAHYNLGAVLLYLGDKDGAMREFGEALALKPDYAPAKYYLEQLKKMPKGAALKLQ